MAVPHSWFAGSPDAPPRSANGVSVKSDFIGQYAAAVMRDRLLLCGVLLLALSPVLAIAVGIDDRSLFGRSPWEKPLRFALSLGVYAVSMALAARWLAARTQLPGWRWVAAIVLGALSFEMAWILVQAARGVDSHFNDRTPFEDLMFALMGAGAALLSIGALWLGLAALCLVHAAATNDRLIALGIGLGFVSTGLLLPWTGEALVDVGRSQSAIGAGPTMPLLGWRFDGSDPRPEHFSAAHAMQVLPLMAMWLSGSGRRPGGLVASGLLVMLTAIGVTLTVWLMP